jgi:hypothetical protein
MTNLFVTELNCETGIAVDRPMTDAELKDYKARQDDNAAQQLAQDKMIQDKQAAQAKLAALGLTPDDLKALGL